MATLVVPVVVAAGALAWLSMRPWSHPVPRVAATTARQLLTTPEGLPRAVEHTEDKARLNVRGAVHLRMNGPNVGLWVTRTPSGHTYQHRTDPTAFVNPRDDDPFQEVLAHSKREATTAAAAAVSVVDSARLAGRYLRTKPGSTGHDPRTVDEEIARGEAPESALYRFDGDARNPQPTQPYNAPPMPAGLVAPLHRALQDGERTRVARALDAVMPLTL